MGIKAKHLLEVLEEFIKEQKIPLSTPLCLKVKDKVIPVRGVSYTYDLGKGSGSWGFNCVNTFSAITGNCHWEDLGENFISWRLRILKYLLKDGDITTGNLRYILRNTFNAEGDEVIDSILPALEFDGGCKFIYDKDDGRLIMANTKEEEAADETENINSPELRGFVQLSEPGLHNIMIDVISMHSAMAAARLHLAQYEDYHDLGDIYTVSKVLLTKPALRRAVESMMLKLDGMLEIPVGMNSIYETADGTLVYEFTSDVARNPEEGELPIYAATEDHKNELETTPYGKDRETMVTIARFLKILQKFGDLYEDLNLEITFKSPARHINKLVDSWNTICKVEGLELCDDEKVSVNKVGHDIRMSINIDEDDDDDDDWDDD
jgi:hypothetical protein